MSFVVFNPDPTSPLQLLNTTDIGTVEIYSPSATDPLLYNPNAPNPNAPNSDLASPNAPNPNAPNPNAPNTNIISTPVFDAIYSVTNTGNTAASYRVKLVGNNPLNIPVQLAVNKTYQTPTSSTYQQTPTGMMTCQLTTENHNNVQAFINNPPIVSPTNLNDTGILDPSSGNATFTLFPGETALVVLRGYFASYTDPAAAFTAFKSLITQVVPAVVSHAANTNTNAIVVSAPLLITTTSPLPDGVVGRTYPATQLMTVGGNPGPLTWAIVSDSGTLPAVHRREQMISGRFVKEKSCCFSAALQANLEFRVCLGVRTCLNVCPPQVKSAEPSIRNFL